MTDFNKYTTRWLHIIHSRKKSGIKSDGDGGPDDGINHIHPEDVFHNDLKSHGFPGFHFH